MQNEKRPRDRGHCGYELRVPAAWLRREVDAGRIPCLCAGRNRLFDVEAVVTVLAQRAAQGRGDCDEQ